MQELNGVTIGGRYQIQRHLARGGMANIYLAQDIQTERQVALKMVHTSASEHCERFRHETREMAALSHEHILPVLDYGEFEEWCYLVMPYIADGTLNDRIQQGPLDLDEAGEILTQLASALQFAHEQGILHRDIKPSNVLMRDGQHAYLADFGLVKRVGTQNNLTLSGCLMGTPEYLAPELAESEGTPCSDIYALGILLYQMLTGRVPFQGNTPINIYLKHINELPEPPALLNPAIPQTIEHVILRAIEKEPQYRFQSAAEFAQAYIEALTISRSTLALATAMLANIEPAQIKVRKIRQTRPALWLVAILVLAIFCLTPLFLNTFASHGASTRSVSGAGGQPHHATVLAQPKPLIDTTNNTGTATPTAVPTAKPIATPVSTTAIQPGNDGQNGPQGANNGNGQVNGSGQDNSNGQVNGNGNGQSKGKNKDKGKGKNKD